MGWAAKKFVRADGNVKRQKNQRANPQARWLHFASKVNEAIKNKSYIHIPRMPFKVKAKKSARQ